MHYRLLTALVICSSFCPAIFMGAENQLEPVEGAPVFFSHEILPQIVLKTDAYTICPLVEVHDFIYEFKVDSRYGNYRVRGMKDLRKLLHELEVIRKLEEIGQTEAFASSLTNALTSPFAMTYGIASRPIASVVGLPTGIGRYIGGKFRGLRKGTKKVVETVRDFDYKSSDEDTDEASDETIYEEIVESADELSRKHLGHDSAKRWWAQRLRVDPYSENAALHEALSRIAWASSLGSFAGDLVVPSSDVFSYAGKAQELVWDRPSNQLEREIIAGLKKAGVQKESIEGFLESPYLTLTEKTELCLRLRSLKSCSQIPFLVEQASELDSKEKAAKFMRTLAVIVKYNEEIAAIESVGKKQGFIWMSSRNGYEIYPIAVDYLHWTPLVYEKIMSEEFDARDREIWVAGIVSPVAKLRLRHHGWEVFDRVDL